MSWLFKLYKLFIMNKIKTISLEEFSDMYSDKIAESCEDKGLTQQLDFSLEQEIEKAYKQHQAGWLFV